MRLGLVRPFKKLSRVQGMSCGGCAASVKRILEAQVSTMCWGLSPLPQTAELVLDSNSTSDVIATEQPRVSSAVVNLATETALVRVKPEVDVPNALEIAKRELAEFLAKHLTSCGFKSSVRGATSYLQAFESVLMVSDVEEV